MKPKMYFNWSSGKDASLALYHILKEGKFDVAHLLTSVNAHYDRITMHGLQRVLLEQQVQAIGIPLHTIELPEQPTMEVYEDKMQEKLQQFRAEGISNTAFGDIYLEDLRAYRESKLATLGIQAHFPLWKRDTKELLQEFLDLGFKAVTVCINGNLMDKSLVGREIDESFIRDLPDTVDVCGENGEFHTFCYDGPIFKKAIPFTIGEKTFKAYQAPKKDEAHDNEKTMGFWFCDLLPVKSNF